MIFNKLLNFIFVNCELCEKRILKINSVAIYLSDDIKSYYKTYLCQFCAEILERKNV